MCIIMSSYRIEPLAECHREMFGDLVLTSLTPLREQLPRQIIQPIPYDIKIRRASMDSVTVVKRCAESDKRRASSLVEQLLMDIYNSVHTTTDYNSTSGKSHRSSWMDVVNLQEKDVDELVSILSYLKGYVERMGSVLVRQLKRRDTLRRQQDAYCDVITKQLVKRVPQGDSSEDMRFSIQPLPGDTGFSQWVSAMKMVAQLPGGIPPEFRRRLWLQLADRHLLAKGVDWPKVERTCFSEWSHPADAELGVQIVKDLHRTGCSLFCGEDGQENQVLLKRVLLAYARWNKAVGYCQGFNMLAALILQVTDKCESDALKLMIYLIEGVLPDSYFADSLRGLSVDMAVFRELLRTRFPRLSKHLDNLQNAAKDGSRSYEPPLTNVFTMQWFLTLFCNCLPQPTVLRVWDLILLEGNEVLLRTALAIWQVLAERIFSVRSADEFYCMMGVLTRELLESELVDGNVLIKAVVAIGTLTELTTLREHYMYNINPWGTNLPQVVDKQLKLYPKQSIALDISGLKQQYAKLKHRQRQAHIIFSAAISRQPPAAPPVTMNHLLLGKSALIPAKRIGPPKGAIPPARQVVPSTLHWKDAPKPSSSSSSSDTELCDEGGDTSDEEEEKGQFDNLPIDSDTNLMKNDNISATVDVGTHSSPSKTNTIPTDTLAVDDNLIMFKSESDEESFDFEQFLNDRLKVNDVAEEKVDYARRNSERALQIIQENSLILHRILQCQSRSSPSPPLLETIETTMEQDLATSLHNSHSFIESTAVTGVDKPFDTDAMQKQIDSEYNSPVSQTEELKSPEYGSKYTSILEKSKSLDEKYHELILNKPVSKTFEQLSTNFPTDANKIDSITQLKSPEVFTINEETTNETNTDQPSVFTFDGLDIPSVQKSNWREELSSVLNANKQALNKKYDEETSQKNDEEDFSFPPEDKYNFIDFKTDESDTDYTTKEASNVGIILDSKEKLESYYPSSNNEGYAFKLPELSPLEAKPLEIDFKSYLHISNEHENDNNSDFKPYFKRQKSDNFPEDSDSGILSASRCSSDPDKLHQPLNLSEYRFDANLVDNNFLASQNFGQSSESLTSPIGQKPSTTCYSFLTTDEEGKSLKTYLEDASICDINPITKSFNVDVVPCSSSTLKSPLSPLSPLKSPLKSPYRSPSSPNATFNPFPVPLSSRQNKEVPLKLGLYKK
ncbi:unnamed protein product [Diabrotica balteata]|uniref:TBC1 domain family member 30 n=1 Tax=Diabrotica balteata TaxID=107213 RepID=A0A9N9X8M5_DIABA|nr:unnamed protein product [Diabrotica balteata]